MAVAFDNFGVKRVSKTDAAKHAYVPNKKQVASVHAAGIPPSENRPAEQFKIAVLGDPAKQWVKASYYHSMRIGSSRTGEPRMGQEIASWLKEGDFVLIGNVGPCLFIEKIALAVSPGATKPSAPSAADVARAAQKAAKKIMSRAKKAKGKPGTQTVTRKEFIRDRNVAAAALLRANGKCELPGCTAELFRKANNEPYLEAHHITPLAEGGDDTLENAAGLCPHHHRAVHHGRDRMKLRKLLRKHIASIAV
jgi:hypothetical protein